jgi:hypothetical protein
MVNPNVRRDDDDRSGRPERNRDPGADLQSQGIPETAEEWQPGGDAIPEPILPIVPTEEPAGVNQWGTTLAEMRDGEPMERKLSREEPEPRDDPGRPDPDVWAGTTEDDDPAGSVVQPDQGSPQDVDKGEYASAYGGDEPESRLSAEDLAVRVREEPDPR